MPGLERLKIKGYRRLLDVDLGLKPLNVLIGVNGSGKTSLLEVLALLSASSNGQLGARLSDLGGLSDVMTRDRAEAVDIDLAMPIDGKAPLDYHLKLEIKGQSYWMREESLTQWRGQTNPFKFIEAAGGIARYYDAAARGLIALEWGYNQQETVLSQLPRLLREAEELRSRLAGTTFYGALDVGPRAPVRLPQRMRPAGLPGAQGEDLISCLYSLRENDPDRFEVLEDTLSAAFPDFERLAFPPVAAGMLSMTWKDKNYSRPMYMHQLSEGTLRFLWLATLLESRELGVITLLDEPEVSLHPELLSLLVDLMREASTRSQIIVATHSDRLVRFLRPEELLVVDTEDGIAKFSWADTMNLDAWLEEYTLDELWRMNLTGGRT